MDFETATQILLAGDCAAIRRESWSDDHPSVVNAFKRGELASAGYEWRTPCCDLNASDWVVIK